MSFKSPTQMEMIAVDVSPQAADLSGTIGGSSSSSVLDNPSLPLTMSAAVGGGVKVRDDDSFMLSKSRPCWPLFKAKCSKVFDRWFLLAFILLSITLVLLVENEAHGGALVKSEPQTSSIPYYIGHFMVSFMIACAVHLAVRVAENIFELEPSLVAGYAAGVLFYVSREVRDHEKLHFWDYEGLISPVLGLSCVFFVLQYLVVFYKKFVAEQDVSVFPIAILGLWGVVCVACAIKFNYLFRSPFGTGGDENA